MNRSLSARAGGPKLAEWLPAVLVLVAALGAWQGLIVAFHVQQFLLPKPSVIAQTLWDNGGTLWSAGWYTFQEALGGFAIGSLLGIAFATLVARFRRIGSALMPVAVAANAVPIIAFAPILDNWFNPLSPHSKMAICARPLLLPGDGQHAARPDERPAPAGAAHAQLRRKQPRDLSSRPRADRSALCVHVAQGGERPRDDRRPLSASTSAARSTRSGC